MIKRIVINRINKYLDDMEKIVEAQSERLNTNTSSVVEMANNEFTEKELKELKKLNAKIMILSMIIKEKEDEV